MEHFDAVLSESRGAFSQERTFARGRELAFSALTCLGRHTLTGLLCAGGRQFSDWTAAYRLFEGGRVDEAGVWGVVRRGVGALVARGAPMVVALDDTLLERTGKKVSGASWRRDPQGPKFQTNLVWAQRYVQAVGMVPEEAGAGRARAVPLGLWHAPSARRPGRKASEAEQAAYRARAREMRLSVVGAGKIRGLRALMDAEAENAGRRLVVTVDGGYTNNLMLRHLPERTTLIGRVRKDACMFAVPQAGARGNGRPRVYGEAIATPEALRQDENVPWREVEAWAAGKVHRFEVKTMAPVRWKGAGAQDLSLVVVRPLAYRPRAGSKLLYRQPAYLICTDPQMPIGQVLQSYVWRWEVEVAFREEKTLLGMGQAQVRTEHAVQALPAFIAAAYGCLHVAAARAGIHQSHLARPKWQRPKDGARCSTAQLISLLRSELCARAVSNGFTGFAASSEPTRSPQNLGFHPLHAVVYAHG